MREVRSVESPIFLEVVGASSSREGLHPREFRCASRKAINVLKIPHDLPPAFHEINAIVERSPIRPEAWFDVAGRQFQWRENPRYLSRAHAWLRIVLSLDFRGALKLRMCRQCTRWFVPGQKRSGHCKNPACKQKTSRDTEEYRGKHRAYMRDYREKAGRHSH